MCSHLDTGSLILNLVNLLKMVKKALSNAVKNIKQCHANEYWVSQAVAFYSEGQLGYREKKLIWDVAHKFSVDPSTLSQHIRGKGMLLCHGRDIHLTWVKSFTETLSNGVLISDLSALSDSKWT